jgi:hypothetical protein
MERMHRLTWGTTLLVFFPAVTAAQDSRPGDPDLLVAQLADDDIEVRTRTESALIALGKRALPALERACRSVDPEIAARARQIRATISPLRLLLGYGPGASFGRNETVPAVLHLENLSAPEQVYFASGFCLTIEVLQLHEKPPQEARTVIRHGRGVYSTACFLSSLDFLTLGRGESHWKGMGELHEERGLEFSPAVLGEYPKISLTSPTLAGRYRATVRYAYDRAAYVAQCPRSCPGHGAPRALWNRAAPGPLEDSVEFTIR